MSSRLIDPSPAWLPTAQQGVRMVPCHRWWDAVRAPGFVAHRVADLLRSCGPAIEDQEADTLTWLVPRGAADGWEAIGVQVLNSGVIPVPPAAYRAGVWSAGASVRWLVAPDGGCLAEPGRLRAAIEGAFRGVGGV